MAQQFDDLIAALRAAAEPTRIRILALCEQGDLTVSDLVRILDQSQPSISQHLKPLAAAGLIERIPEGTSTFCRLARKGPGAAFAQAVLGLMPKSDPVIHNDNARFRALKTERAASAAKYFAENAEDWARLRALHVDEARVEASLLDLLKPHAISRLLDMGTGTGRVLELAGPLVETAEGVDLSREMLAIARSKLEAAGLRHCRVRHGDLFNLMFADGGFDAVTIHQVLHFIDNPDAAISEAARVLRPGGILVIADFARHDLEALRAEHKHRHLGFSDEDIAAWCGDAGMKMTKVERLSGVPLTVHLWLAVKPALGGTATELQ